MAFTSSWPMTYGASASPPATGTSPQVWVLVDTQSPLAQLDPVQIERNGRQNVARFRWRALDDQLSERPIEIAYRTLPDGPWQPITGALQNSGAYDWPIPQSISGQVEFRLTVRDRAEHRAETVSPIVRIQPPARAMPAAQRDAYAQNTISPADQQRAHELLRKGRRHQLRGDHASAAARLRDALSINPRQPEALVALGQSLYALRDYEASAEAFELAIEQAPNDPAARGGLSQTFVATGKYVEAEQELLAIIEQHPRDVETWLRLGDVAIYRGREIDARDYYLRAATLEPSAVSVVARAQARLDDLPTLRGAYRGSTAQ
jgi:tetratricopeptide (TPR) repeat protein